MLAAAKTVHDEPIHLNYAPKKKTSVIQHQIR